MLLILLAILLLLIQKFYFLISVAYLVAGVVFLFATISDILPSIYSVDLVNSDGTTTTEVHTLGDNLEQNINMIDAGYISQGIPKSEEV